MMGRMEKRRWCRFGMESVQHEVALPSRGGHWGGVLFRLRRDDYVPRRIIRHGLRLKADYSIAPFTKLNDQQGRHSLASPFSTC
jgi:hypothetical protein